MAISEENTEAKRRWTQNPEAVKADILRVALNEFSAHGLSGTRIDEIAAKTRTSKRMIYYYFGDKLGLYTRALEAAYSEVREGEKALDVGQLEPEAALAKLVEFTFDHHRSHPEFIRMVMIENVHNAEHLAVSEFIQRLNRTAIEKLAEICRRGVASGIFREGIDPIALHWQISAFSFFNVSNRPTFAALFGGELFGDDGQHRLRRQVVQTILAAVRR